MTLGTKITPYLLPKNVENYGQSVVHQQLTLLLAK